MPAAATTVPTPLNVLNVPAFGGVGNGHPEDRYGWALAGGAKFNLPGGDMIGFNVCYSEGAPGFCTNNSVWTLYNSNNSVGVGWIADGVFGTGTQIELTKVWSALAGYEHIWNPKWRTSVFGGYVNVDYGSAATNLILRAHCRARRPPAASPRSALLTSRTTLLPGQQLQPRLRASGKPAPAPSGTRCRSSMSASKCSTPSATPPSKASPSCPPAARGPRSSPSTTRTYGPQCSAGSATSIHDRLSDPGKLTSPRRPTAGGFACASRSIVHHVN